MLKDTVEKERKRSIERTGGCRFCGQIATMRALEEFTEEEMDELATEQCSCPEAGFYSVQKGQKERAHAKIEGLFESGREITEEEAEFLHSTVDPIVTEQLQKVTVEITETLKMTINKTAKGNVKITKKQSISRSQEA